MENLEKRVSEIEKSIKSIDEKLLIIINLLEINSDDCKKMSSHIDFVEETYSTLRNPLEYVKNKFNFLSGNSSSSLPELEDKR